MPLPGWLGFDAGTRTFSGTPPQHFNGTISLKVTASDGSESASDIFDLVIDPVNDAPALVTAIPDHHADEEAPVSYQVPADSFVDVDGDVLAYGATLAGGSALPAWLSFDAATRTFSGTAPQDFNGTLTISVVASDGAESAAGAFDLVIDPVNDAPSGSSATIEMAEDGSRTLAQADFGYGDPAEGHAFAGVVITGLPGNGQLLLNGVPITGAGTFVTAAQIMAGDLVFEPEADENGAPYASFDFQVRDAGGLLNGGQDTDQSANTLTFNVGGVNDGPVNTVPAAAQAFNEDGTLVFGTANGNAIGVTDVDADPGDVTVTLQIADGTLTLAATAGLTASPATAPADVVLTGSLAAVNAALGTG